MPVNRIVNKKSGYYIAMYSAHASIIENLIGKNGTVEKLFIDAGGLRAPKGSFSSPNIFDKYMPTTHKTLHAKIIFLDKKKTLSLWTGNLRKHTLDQEENIVITKKVKAAHCKVIKKWFEQLSTKHKEHLIVSIDGSKITEISSSSRVWDSFKANLKGIEKSDNLHVYAFSPWGSSKFVQQIAKHLGSRLSGISLYTRPASSKCSLWIDSEIGSTARIERFIRKDNKTFPHFKCVFITKQDKRSEKLIWAYVGSANLTEAAFFKKDNIEYAAFFNNVRSSSDIHKIFAKIKHASQWDSREPPSKQTKPLDESTQVANEDKDSKDNQDGFEIRKLSRDLCVKLSTKIWQLKLQKEYENDRKPVKLAGCRLDVMEEHNGIFDIRVRKNWLDFRLPVKRILKIEIYSNEDIKGLISDLLDTSDIAYTTVGGCKRGDRSGNQPKLSAKQAPNIRFPMASVLLDIKVLLRKRKIIEKLSNVQDRLSDDERKLFAMWSNILEEFH